MALFEASQQELTIKIVYYGPAWGGKTCNLAYLRQHCAATGTRSWRVVDLKGDKTLTFEYLALTLAPILDYRVRLQLFTAPGRQPFNAGRKLLLKGVDGIVFVADSLARQKIANLASLDNLRENLKYYDREIVKTPLVMQFNKQDLAGVEDIVISPADLSRDLNAELGAPEVAASATTGMGILETLRRITSLTVAATLAQLN
jgi:hypothetical protein